MQIIDFVESHFCHYCFVFAYVSIGSSNENEELEGKCPFTNSAIAKVRSVRSNFKAFSKKFMFPREFDN